MPELQLSGCSVDLERGLVLTDSGEERWLTSLESALLRYLTVRPGVDVSRDELVREVWRGAGAGRVVDFTVGRLRRKLGEPKHPNHLLTAHGHGYRFVPRQTEPRPPPPMTEVVVTLATGTLHLGKHQFVRDGEPIPLSRIEGQLLEALVEEAGRPVPRATLIARIWGRGRHEHTLDAAIARLRLKLERDPAAPAVLVTARGLGLMLVVFADSGAPLPHPGSSFVDRPERAVLLAAIAGHRLTTALGTAGIGKTRLAHEVAAAWLRSHPCAEVWFCDLTRVTTIDGMVARVSATLEEERTTDPGRVGRMFAARPAGTLVVLDNFEQLVDGGAPIVGAWSETPGIHLLVTSRVPLGLPGEGCVRLDPLDPASGARLFLERAPVHEPDLPSVLALVERLDGLPLAIELAAALADRLPPAAVLERIGARLDLLVVRPEGATSHHSTLRGAIDWSWHLLDDDQRTTLAAVSVFLSAFDEAAARAVIGRPAAALLESLVARSLVRSVDGRWALLESIRDYARERLLLTGGLQAAVERHAEHHAERAAPLAEALAGFSGVEALAELSELREDLFAALEATTRPDLRGRLGRILAARGFLDESRATLHTRLVQALERGVDPADELHLRLAVAHCSTTLRQFARAEAELVRVEEADPPDEELQVAIGLARARLAIVRNDARLGLAWLDVVQERIAKQPWSTSHLRHRAEGAILQISALPGRMMRLDDWRSALDRGLALAEEVGDAHLMGVGLRSAASFHTILGDVDRALVEADRALSLAQRTGRVGDELLARITRVTIDVTRGAFDRALHDLRAFEILGRSSGSAHREVAAIVRGWLAFDRRAFEGVLATVPEGSTWQTLALWATYLRADSLVCLGRPAEAVRVLSSIADPNAHARLHLASALAGAGRHDEADRLVAEARLRVDPQVWGFVRMVSLVEATLALERARGTERWAEVCAAARSVLEAGTPVPCDDGELRERPSEVAHARIVLQCALERIG